MEGTPLTVGLLLGWTVCCITNVLVGMTIPAVVILGPSLVAIVGYQIWYEKVNFT
jgi:hypothetical protein